MNSGNEDSHVNRSWTTPTEITSSLLEGLFAAKKTLIFKDNRKGLTLCKNSCGESEKSKTKPG